ncbi:hypothetical protein D3C79_914310 [compost metagenome]
MGHLPDQKTLNAAVVLGDDEVGVAVDRHGAHADGAAQVDHRDGDPADVRHPADVVVGPGHLVEARQFHHLPHLEHVDRKQLLGAQAEHQQFQAILPHQLGTLIH